MLSLVTDHTILAVVVGSRAYGLAGPGSDHDRRGVYAAPTRLFWKLDKPPTHLDGPQEEQFHDQNRSRPPGREAVVPLPPGFRDVRVVRVESLLDSVREKGLS